MSKQIPNNAELIQTIEKESTYSDTFFLAEHFSEALFSTGKAGEISGGGSKSSQSQGLF